ncbi:tyrosine-type recombinase/integrase [Methylobacterium oryzae]|uniref:Tyr recombinase domain-containing protein n=1 Tax=Methylobacterium oryzae TaxID=334852 RepID=A0ABU7TZV6_9HYPH
MARKSEISVYKPKGSDVFHCRISIDGERKSKSTGCANKRDAEAWAKRWKSHRVKKAEEKAENPGGHIGFLAAVNRFMAEKGDNLAAAADVETFFIWLVDEIGEDTPLVDINDDLVTRLVAKRSLDYRWGRQKAGHVAPIYVQRAVVDRLQSLSTWAKKKWKVKLPDEPDWPSFYVKIQRRTRTMSFAEEEAIFKVAGDLAPIIEFSLLSGVRREDAILRWSQVDWDTRIISLMHKGKVWHQVKITKNIRRLLESVRGHHDEFVFTTTHECRERAGRRVPVTYKSYAYFFEKVCRRAGVKGLTIHDLRRTCGERMYRETHDLAGVSRFLGHANVGVTEKFYVYVTLDDVEERQEAMEDARDRALEERRRRNDGC